MIDKSAFIMLKKEMESAEAKRDKNITLCRSLTKKSKEAIYNIHRDELVKANKLLAEVKKKLPKKPEHVFNPAFEEFAEAMLFMHFVKTGNLLAYSKLKVGAENYVGGVADMTGELARRSVLLSIKRKGNKVEQIRNVVDAIHGEFLKINFKNGDLRRKYDAIKWNLEKIEKVLYDVKKK